MSTEPYAPSKVVVSQTPALRSTITFAAPHGSSFVRYAAGLIADFCGIHFVAENAAAAGIPVDLHYGNDAQHPCRIRVPSTAPYTRTTIPVLPEQKDFLAAERPDSVFPFDLFEALRFWLTDAGNDQVSQEGLDAHERLRSSFSAQESLGLRQVPLVNAYLVLMRHWLEVRCGALTRRVLPPGKNCAIVLSHDVDNPIDPSDYPYKLWLARKAAKFGQREYAFDCLKDGVHCFARRMAGCRDRFDLFDNVERAEDRFGVRSTFFFASQSRLEGSRFDVPYDASAPRFQSVFKNMKSRGWEIGLHISYDALKCDGRVKAEKKRLEEIVGEPIRGARHHYWHLGRQFWKTAEQHECAGLEYDSSIAFNEAPGYRLGIAYPFHPWSPTAARGLKTLEIPTVVMDGNYFYQPCSAESALTKISEVLDGLKRFDGIAAIDWHSHTSYPAGAQFGEWGRAYLLLLEKLTSDSSICVFSFAQLLAQLRKRDLASLEHSND